MCRTVSPGRSGEAEGGSAQVPSQGWGAQGGLWPLKPARHPHEGAQGGAGGSPCQQPQRHLVPGDAVGILTHDDVGHPRSCKGKRALSDGGTAWATPRATPRASGPPTSVLVAVVARADVGGLVGVQGHRLVVVIVVGVVHVHLEQWRGGLGVRLCSLGRWGLGS